MQANSLKLVVFFMVSLVSFVILLLLSQNPSFGLLEGLSEGKVVRGIRQNVTTELLTEAPFVTTKGSELGGRDKSDNTFKSSKIDDKDKLLDGLLVSGFDEASCISRLESHLYRKASPHKPSQYLISKLRRYEEIHRRCGPNSKAYQRDMTNIAQSMKNNATTMCKYIIWSPENGLGNQIISMASTFLYALLTDRVMLVEFGKDKHNLFCEPFLNSTWLLPENSHFKNVTTFQSIVDKGIMGNISKKGLSSVLLVDLKYYPEYPFPERYFHCDNSQDLLNKVPLLIFHSDQFFVPSLFITPVFNKELNKMFPNKVTIFNHLGRYLLHPSNEAWGMITSFYKAHFAKADEKIGLQIRVYESDTTPQKVFMNQLLNCTLHNKLLPQIGIQNSTSSGNKNQTVKGVLVASLSQEYGKNLRAMYQNKSTVTGEVIDVYQPSHENRQKYFNNEHNMKAWVEMYLLSLSDVLVTTYFSTFGYVARGLGNSKAWLLYKARDDGISFPACEQELSLEPCYHFPPSHYCNGNPMKDITSSFPYIRHCKDTNIGWKLINDSI